MRSLCLTVLLLAASCSRGPQDPSDWLEGVYSDLLLTSAAEIGAAAIAGEVGDMDLMPALKDRMHGRLLFPPGEDLEDRKYRRHWRALERGILESLSGGLIGDSVEFELEELDPVEGRAKVRVNWSGPMGWSGARSLLFTLVLRDEHWLIDAGSLPGDRF